MSKIKKGVTTLFSQGPVAVLKKVRDKCNEKKKIRDFQKEVKDIHIITPKQREYQKEKNFENPVKFSIITPLYNTPKDYLLELIQSMERQTYSNWELCLADGSDDQHQYMRKICEQWCKKDKRIVYSVLPENKGISLNTNACIELSSGQYFGLLDHDDVLHESALYEMMSEIEQTNADFLYSDEVKFSKKIEDAVDFNFKPGFGKDELRSHNYICHFTVFSRTLLEKVGQVYRPEFDGSQDHDMVLRLTEKASKIVHVPKVLYYWRVHPESVSMNLDAKSYAVDAAIRAVQEQLEREKEYGKVASNLPYRTIYRIKYEIDVENCVTIAVHNLETVEDFERYKEKILAITSYSNVKFVPVYNESDQNWGKALNAILNQMMTDYFIIMDSQCVPVNSDWIEEMLMFAQRRDVALVSPKVLYQNDTIAYAGIAVDKNKKDKIRFLCQGIPDSEQGYEAILRYVRNTTGVWKGCFMISKETFLNVGGFNEDMSKYEDVDLSLEAIKKGYINVWTCFAKIRYCKDSIDDFANGDTEKFVTKWNDDILKNDPYYHNNWEKFKLV